MSLLLEALPFVSDIHLREKIEKFVLPPEVEVKDDP
jgi:hypothetical protein